MSELAHDLIEISHGPVVPVMSKAPRAMFVANPGNRLIGGDFSNIEGRINAWMAGEEWKLDAFRAYDEKRGPDLYYVSYSKAFGVPLDQVTKYQRNEIGKKIELSCGYQGSVGAWLRFAGPEKVTKLVRETMHGGERWLVASLQYDRAIQHYGLSADQWISIKIVSNAWREGHPRITQSWWDLQDSAIEAVDTPGVVVSVLEGKVRYLSAEGFLWCRLPSGKLLAYCRPRLVETAAEYLVDADGEMFPVEEFSEEELALHVMDGGEIHSERRRIQVEFDGKNQKTNAWSKQRLYGGMQCNNVVQGTARELLRFAMQNVELADYPVVLHVHDELVAEVQQEFGSVAEMQSLMSILPEWLRGLPLSAKAWEDKRYVK